MLLKDRGDLKSSLKQCLLNLSNPLTLEAALARLEAQLEAQGNGVILLSFDLAFVHIRPAYEIPHDDLVGEVLIPAMRSCDEVRLAAGFLLVSMFIAIGARLGGICEQD